MVESRVCVDSAPLFERDLAVRAGFAFLGKNTLAIAPGWGSFFVLGELLVDLALPASNVQASEGCGSCDACLRACPTDAFDGPYRLDPRRCVSFLTIESSLDIPRSLRSGMGDRIFGCDDCQTACPYNHSKRRPSPPPDFVERGELARPGLVELLSLSSSGYRRLVSQTALRRVSRVQLARNAAVALGNSGQERAVEPLVAVAKTHSSPQVRSHATWALGRLACDFEISDAREALCELAMSPHLEVASEVRRWLPADDAEND